MSEWFQVKVTFLRQMDNGLIKKVTEQYIVDALSFTEAESRVLDEIGNGGKGVREITMMSAARSPIKEVVPYGDTDLWFKAKVTYSSMDEESEKERKITTHILVNANDVREAYDRVSEHLKDMLVPFQIPKVEESPIVEVFQHIAGLRSGLKKAAPSGDPSDGSPHEFEVNCAMESNGSLVGESCETNWMVKVHNVKDRLPHLEGSYLVYAPESFPKNSRWMVAEYYADVEGFYSESSDNFIPDVTHWCDLPDEPPRTRN